MSSPVAVLSADTADDRAFTEQAVVRVTAVIDAASVSGPGRQLAALANALRSCGVRLHVITFARDGSNGDAFRAFLRASGVTFEVVRERARFDPLSVLRLGRALRRQHPDVVQTHGYKPSTYVWLLRRFRRAWAWVGFYHGATFENRTVRLYNRLHDWVLRSADEVVAMSARQLPGIRNQRVRVIHNAVLELPAASETSLRAALDGLPASRPTLLVIGRLSPEKGVDVMLHALRRCVDRGGEFTLLVVGDGPERSRLEALAIELQLRQFVRFFPATADVRAAYQAADAVVIPSRSEGLPNVLLEAIAHDRPVLATDVGAVREVLGTSRAGVIVPSESPEALADGVEAVLALRGDAQASRDRSALIERFSLRARTQAHVQLYRDVMRRVHRA